MCKVQQTVRKSEAGSQSAMTMMTARDRIRWLKSLGREIHVSYHQSASKAAVVDVVASIKNTYAHLFEIEFDADGRKQVKTFTYGDLICKRVLIAELNK